MISSILATGSALVAVASAHGHIASINVGEKTYAGADGNWMYQNPKPTTPGWYAYNLDNGFVSPDAYASTNITCHKGATPGNQEVVVAAGQTVALHWSTWPISHHGPVLNYLAKCSGSCTTATATELKFTKITEDGLIDDSSPPGDWAVNKITNKVDIVGSTFESDFTVPAHLAPGHYVLRHEIIALHAAGQANGAQNYPQCINLQVTGSGTTNLPAGVSATTFYKANDPGILVDIYSKLSSYSIPGPTVWTGAN